MSVIVNMYEQFDFRSKLRPFKSLGGASSGQGAPHPQDKPPDENYNWSESRNITYELPLYEKYGHFLDSTQLEALVRNMYKRKDQKILPVNQPLPNGINPSDIFAPDPGGGWVEARAIPKASSFYVSKFLYEVCRHGCPRRFVFDGGRENLDLTKDLLQYRI